MAQVPYKTNKIPQLISIHSLLPQSTPHMIHPYTFQIHRQNVKKYVRNHDPKYGNAIRIMYF